MLPRGLRVLVVVLLVAVGLIGTSRAPAAPPPPASNTSSTASAPYTRDTYASPGGEPQAHIEASPLRPGRVRPVVAVVGHNAFTELTDYVVPYGVLKLADVADVFALGTGPGPVRLFPAFTVQADATIAEFDSRYPAGADYVVVPAVHEDEDPALLAWVRQQRDKGATLVGICDGVWVLARAGVLRGHRATGHWYSRSALARQFPDTRWVDDRRYVADGKVVTTTGVTASIPVSLALVEAIGGTARAAEVARRIGAAGWSDAYAATPFRLGARHLYTAARNTLAFWRHEDLGAALQAGGDDIALALAADAFARTYRSRVLAIAPVPAGVRLRSGLVFLPDRGDAAGAALPQATAHVSALAAVPALDATLRDIAQRYGADTADFVALQLEYPGDWRRGTGSRD